MLIFIVRNGELIDMQGGAIIIFKNDMEFGMKASRCIDIFELSKHDRYLTEEFIEKSPP